jgi:hypothetical protein
VKATIILAAVLSIVGCETRVETRRGPEWPATIRDTLTCVQSMNPRDAFSDNYDGYHIDSLRLVDSWGGDFGLSFTEWEVTYARIDATEAP